MRLLYVSHSHPPEGAPLANVGGMQRAAVELHEALAAHPGVELRALVLRSRWSERHRRVPLFVARALPAIARMARGGEIDAVLFSSIVTGALAIPLGRRLARAGIPAAAIVYGLDVSLPGAPARWIVPRILGALDVLLPISRATAETCLARGADPARTRVVPLGVDPGRFAPFRGERPAVRRRLDAALGDRARPLRDGTLLLCSVGRLVRRKGFAWFAAEVMPRLPADVHWWLAGDGPEAPAVRDAIARHGLEGRARILGAVPESELGLLYAGADLFVMPNVAVPGDMEGLGLVMLEAGVCGLPSVAASLEGITDVITDGENGELVSSGDASAFVTAIGRWREDREALRALSARTERWTRERFAWARAVEGMVEGLEARRPGR